MNYETAVTDTFSKEFKKHKKDGEFVCTIRILKKRYLLL